ncbi:MAG: RluA family pseudouridine synthase [Ruminococcaceae bacterium]|nr:RluA family pseudouridine synthase [Oscillospiraceae bacterium]
MQTLTFRVEAAEAGARIDKYLSERADLTRSAAVRLIEEGGVSIGGASVSKNYKVRCGDEITIVIPEPEPDTALPEDIPLDVVYEDDDIIVINKPVGMVVHPAAGNPSGTLVNALLFHCKGSLSGIGGVLRPGIVHRIDKDTSGLLVVAKNDRAHLHLAEQIKEHSAHRIYRAVCVGNVKEDEGTIDLPIGRHPVDRKKMAVIRDPDREARDAVTHYRVLERFAGRATWGNAFTYIECRLETGRTHQIRVHMAAKGHPLLGDEVYGGDNTPFGARHKAWIKGQTLHACELHLTHPTTGERMHFSAPEPPEMTKLLEILRRED